MGGAARDDARSHTVFPVPPYLPHPPRALPPWTRRYVAATARRSQLPLADAWDEAITALLRAAVYFQPGAGTFHAYARTAVIRGLWRYCRRPSRLPLDELPARALTAPSAETLVALADTAADYLAAERQRITGATCQETSSTRSAVGQSAARALAP